MNIINFFKNAIHIFLNSWKNSCKCNDEDFTTNTLSKEEIKKLQEIYRTKKQTFERLK